MTSIDAIQSYVALSILMLLVVGVFILLLRNNQHSKLYKFIEKHSMIAFISIIVLSLLGRMAVCFFYYGIEELIPDALLFRIWAQTVFEKGLPAVYSPEIHAEHGPMLMYIFYIFEFVSQLLGGYGGSLIHTMLIKMPAMLAEIAIGILIYWFANKKIGKVEALLLSCFAFLSPAWVLDSSMWGQVDSLFTLFIVIAFIYLIRDKKIVAAIFYALACLFKAQTLFVAPVFGLFYVFPILKKDTRKQGSKTFVISLLAGVATFTLLVLPFKEKVTDLWVVDFFNRIIAVKPKNTNGAFNLFGLYGGNCRLDTESFLFLDYRTWGIMFIVLICAVCVFLCYKAKDKKIEFLLAAFCLASIYFLVHTMNERYILPLLALLPFSYARHRDKRLLFIMVFITFTASIDQMLFLFDLFGGRMLEFRIFAGLNFVCYLYFVYVVFDTVYCIKNNYHKKK